LFSSANSLVISIGKPKVSYNLKACFQEIVSISLQVFSKAVLNQSINFSNSFNHFSKVSKNCFSSLSISVKIKSCLSKTFG